MGKNVVWSPQPRQAAFMARAEYEALYGGAAGGGKSEALVLEALRQVDIPHYKGLLLRKTYPELEELIGKSQNYYPLIYPKAKYNEAKHSWTFPSGAKVIFGDLHRTQDKLKYQGRAYDYIAFDELTHFTLEEYIYLISRNRPNGPGTRCYIRASANPGGVGHGWVKDRFITPAPPMTTMWTDHEYVTPEGKRVVGRLSRIFIPASVFDNKALLDANPEYITRLASMPEAEREALLYGNWDSYTGQVFAEWKNDPAHYEDRRWTHVIKPFDIPDGWNIYRSFDWGYAKPFSCGWWAVDYQGVAYRILELYGCKESSPDTGVKWNNERIFEEIARTERDHRWLKGKQIIGVADPAIWAQNGGPSIAEVAASRRVYFNKGDHERIPGWMQLHYRLSFDEEGFAQMYVFNNCRDFIRTLPALQFDDVRVEDVDSSGEDHCLVGDTLIRTDEGYVPIERLVGKEGLVLSHDGEYHRFSDVRMTRRKAKVYRVELEDGTVFEGTEDHRIMREDGTWVRIKDMLPNKTEVRICR